jgi:acyl carrier protein
VTAPTITGTAVRQLVADHYCVDVATLADPATNLLAIDGADSLDALELAIRIEDAFTITLTDDEVDATDTIGALIAIVERKVSEHA